MQRDLPSAIQTDSLKTFIWHRISSEEFNSKLVYIRGVKLDPIAGCRRILFALGELDGRGLVVMADWGAGRRTTLGLSWVGASLQAACLTHLVYILTFWMVDHLRKATITNKANMLLKECRKNISFK